MTVELLPDIQGSRDTRGIAIDEVGVSGLRHPMIFDDGTIEQTGVAEIEMTVGLPSDCRGTHMSRMIQAVETHLSRVNPYELHTAFKAIAALLYASELSISLSLPVATKVKSPVTANSGYQVHDFSMSGRLSSDGFVLTTSVATDVTTLCPCSKAISDYGAHNQRSRVSLSICGENDAPYPVNIDEIIQLIGASGSSPVYPVVKRPDERAITMAAYDNPKFVEDLVRDLTLSCRRLGVPHEISARNVESIHSHDAVARLCWKSIVR